jgi:hypothetical protein
MQQKMVQRKLAIASHFTGSQIPVLMGLVESRNRSELGLGLCDDGIS